MESSYWARTGATASALQLLVGHCPIDSLLGLPERAEALEIASLVAAESLRPMMQTVVVCVAEELERLANVPEARVMRREGQLGQRPNGLQTATGMAYLLRRTAQHPDLHLAT